MYTVKSFKPGQTIYRIELSNEKTMEWRSQGSTEYVVFGPDDKPVFSTNPLSGKKQMEVYKRKSVALEVADYYNRKG
jgi:hypothetical protein